MSDITTNSAGVATGAARRRGPELDAKPHGSVAIIVIRLLVIGIGVVLLSLASLIALAPSSSRSG